MRLLCEMNVQGNECAGEKRNRVKKEMVVERKRKRGLRYTSGKENPNDRATENNKILI